MKKERTPGAEAGRPLNLLIVTSTLYLGGAQRVASILASALSERHRVTVAYCYDTGRRLPFGSACTMRKLPEYDSGAPAWKKAFCILRQIRALRSIKREMDIDASLSLGNLCNLINSLSRTGDCVICSERSNPKRSWGGLFCLIRGSFRRADFVVFQSEQVRSLFDQRIRRKSCILKNPVQLPPPAYGQRAKKVVALGRLAPQKNHAMLIRSFSGLCRQFPEYSLHIYGEGTLEPELRDLIASLDLSDRVFLEGNRPDVLDRIRDAEMFVLSSDYEGLSNALLECMSMGIACISTKCEGSVEVIRHGENGLLVDIGDEAALTRAMCGLAEHAELRDELGRRAREDLKAYDMATVVRDWERMIFRCLSRE